MRLRLRLWLSLILILILLMLLLWLLLRKRLSAGRIEVIVWLNAAAVLLWIVVGGGHGGGLSPSGWLRLCEISVVRRRPRLQIIRRVDRIDRLSWSVLSLRMGPVMRGRGRPAIVAGMGLSTAPHGDRDRERDSLRPSSSTSAPSFHRKGVGLRVGVGG